MRGVFLCAILFFHLILIPSVTPWQLPLILKTRGALFVKIKPSENQGLFLEIKNWKCFLDSSKAPTNVGVLVRKNKISFLQKMFQNPYKRRGFSTVILLIIKLLICFRTPTNVGVLVLKSFISFLIEKFQNPYKRRGFSTGKW